MCVTVSVPVSDIHYCARQGRIFWIWLWFRFVTWRYWTVLCIFSSRLEYRNFRKLKLYAKARVPNPWFADQYQFVGHFESSRMVRIHTFHSFYNFNLIIEIPLFPFISLSDSSTNRIKIYCSSTVPQWLLRWYRSTILTSSGQLIFGTKSLVWQLFFNLIRNTCI